ncbi:MAG: UpxY family transcription antiterminator [Bacteroidota bacterium]
MSTAQAKENHLHDTEERWFAVYTRFKCEKVVHKDLQAKGIECYVPLQEVTRRYTRKIKTHHIPLISCYVFVKVNRKNYVRVLETDYVLNYVKIGRNLIAIPEEEIEILKAVTREGVITAIEDRQLQVGDNVEIIGGRLTGLKGKLIETDNGKRLVVELEMLGKDIYMEVSPELLRKARP